MQLPGHLPGAASIFFSFSWFMKQQGTHIISYNTRTIRWKWIFHLRFILLIYYLRKLETTLLDWWYIRSRSCQFFIQKFPVPQYHSMLTLHNPIKPLNVIGLVSLEHPILYLPLREVQTSWGGWKWPKKQFQSKSIWLTFHLSRVSK